jgi:hypothetical protein
MLVTGRISGELAFKAARARIAVVATPSIPSTIAVDIAKAARMVLVGRAVSGNPQFHREPGIGNRESQPVPQSPASDADPIDRDSAWR